MKLGKQSINVVNEMIKNGEIVPDITLREEMMVKMYLSAISNEQVEIDHIFEIIGHDVDCILLDGAITYQDSKYNLCLVTYDDRLILMNILHDEVYILPPSFIRVSDVKRMS